MRGVAARIREEIGHWLRRDWSLQEVAAHWDATEDYDDINAETYSYFRRFVDGLRLSDLDPNSHVLDVCARTGNGTLYFWEKGRIGSAVCADVSMSMGEVCQKRLKEAGVRDFEWVQLTDYHMPFCDGSFDAVLCFETVEHLAKPERLVREIARVTRPGGTLVLTTPNVLWEPIHALAAVTGLHHSEGPHRFIRRKRLRSMIQDAGFEIRTEETTVLVPGGPGILVRAGEWLEKIGRTTFMPLLGLRRIFVCRRKA